MIDATSLMGLGLREAMRACEWADELDDPKALFEERRRSDSKEGREVGGNGGGRRWDAKMRGATCGDVT